MKKNVVLNSAVLGLASLVFGSSCSKTKDKAAETKAKVDETLHKTEEKKDLQGDFQSDGTNQLSVATQGVGCVAHEISVKGEVFTVTQTAFSETDCKGSALGKIVTEATMKIGPENDAAPGARDLDLKITKVDVTPLKDSWGGVLGVDVTGECDIHQMAVNETKDVNGKNCGVLGKFPTAGSVYFTTYRLANDKTLEFTKLPQESLDHVGSESQPAGRNKGLVVNYYRK